MLKPSIRLRRDESKAVPTASNGVMPDQAPPPSQTIAGFKGVNNRIDPTRLGWESQLEAVNVLCDDAGYLTRRPGLTSLATGYVDAYGTRNGRLLLITTGDDLVERFEDGRPSVKAHGVAGAPFVWCELGYALFLMSPTAQWAVYPDRVIPWGSLCPPPPTVPYPIGDPISYPPPKGQVLCSRRSQMVVGVWEPERDRSVLYFSRPDSPHEFRLDRDWIIIPGQVTLLVSLAQGLVIGTDRAIYTDPIDSPIQRVADYGVPLNAAALDDRNTVYFWSERGLCKAFPFENMTDSRLAVTVRHTVTAGIFPFQGSTYAVVSQTGDPTPRQLTRPFVPPSISTTYSQGLT